MPAPVTLKGHMHTCPAVDPGPKPHVGGPVVSTGQNFVTVNGIPIATIGDPCLCSGVPTTAGITSGSSVATINGKKVARIGDSCEHGGQLVQGVGWLTFE
jgi:uncharacterized Zn-binding protein involved in type VI secretion